MGLNVLDLGVIVAYLAGVTLFGLHFLRKQQTPRNYFLAGNSIPWWAISLSIVAADRQGPNGCVWRSSGLFSNEVTLAVVEIHKALTRIPAPGSAISRRLCRLNPENLSKQWVSKETTK
jgi:hypothetical protein